MRLSLRAWLILILVVVNAGVLGALAVWVSIDEAKQGTIHRQRTSEFERRVRALFSEHFEPERAGDIAKMLEWAHWREFEEALILDTRLLNLTVEGNDLVVPVGTTLNPLGRQHRGPEFELGVLARGIQRAVVTREPISLAGGLALPLIQPDQTVWGGVFVRLPGSPVATSFAVRTLFAAAAVTLLVGGLVYLLLGRAVVSPMEKLVEAAQEFGRGGAPSLPESPRMDEVDGLLRAFRDMMERIRGFQGELEHEVENATHRAADAERRAARQERLAAMGTLAAGLAHEINSPLAGALQGLETLRKEARSDRAQRYGELSAEALERIRGLVQRLLQLAPARVESGRCSLRAALADLPAFLESRLGRHRLQIELPEQELEVNGSVGDLFPVFLNLVRNALDALDELPEEAAGQVQVVGSALANGGAEVVIRDDGPGVPESLLPHIFEPFVTSKEVGKGTGLGLALAYATVRQLGGELEASNRSERSGFEVRLRLPGPWTAAETTARLAAEELPASREFTPRTKPVPAGTGRFVSSSPAEFARLPRPRPAVPLAAIPIPIVRTEVKSLPAIVPLGNGRYQVDASLSLEGFQERFGDLGLPSSSGGSLGEWMSEKLGRPPEQGDRVRIGSFYQGWDLTVARRAGDQVTQLELQPATGNDGTPYSHPRAGSE